MKRFLPFGAGLLVVVLAVFAYIPKVQGALGMRQAWRAANPELAALQDQLSAQQDSLRAWDVARERLLSLEAAARLPRTTATLAFSSDVNTLAETREAFEQQARAELAPLGDSLRYPVRVHLITDSTQGGYQLTAVLPQDGSTPCVLLVLVADRSRGTVRPMAGERLIGPCGFYATFGAPGPGMLKWLLDTRGVHAATDAAAPMAPRGGKHRVSMGDVARAPEVAACSAGSDSLCVRAWGGSRSMGVRLLRDTLLDAATRGTVRLSIFSQNYAPSRNLSDLRVAMTDARFVDLWKSEKDPITAYEEIEGRSIAMFARERIHDEIIPHRPGPLHADLSLVLGIAIAASFAALTIRLTKRQRS